MICNGSKMVKQYYIVNHNCMDALILTRPGGADRNESSTY